MHSQHIAPFNVDTSMMMTMMIIIIIAIATLAKTSSRCTSNSNKNRNKKKMYGNQGRNMRARNSTFNLEYTIFAKKKNTNKKLLLLFT